MNARKGQPVESVIAQFFGDLDRWPMEPDGLNFTQAQVKAICQRIHETGECLWHGEFVVMQWQTCHCANCDRRPPRNPRGQLKGGAA